jgi:uncharacterized protein YqcC (DUF446 family)
MLVIRPDLRILVCSGTPFIVETASASRVLQKPFVPKMLDNAIKKLLGMDRDPVNTSQ